MLTSLMPWLKKRLCCRGSHRELISSGLFDREWFLKRYPSVLQQELPPEEYFLRHSLSQSLHPNALFDTAWYLHSYGDVREAGILPLWHYYRIGFREGRDPHPHFSTRRYLKNHPDVAAADINPLAHYLQYGREEGREVMCCDGIALSDRNSVLELLETIESFTRSVSAAGGEAVDRMSLASSEFLAIVERIATVHKKMPCEASRCRDALISHLLKVSLDALTKSVQVPKQGAFFCYFPGTEVDQSAVDQSSALAVDSMAVASELIHRTGRSVLVLPAASKTGDMGMGLHQLQFLTHSQGASINIEALDSSAISTVVPTAIPNFIPNLQLLVQVLQRGVTQVYTSSLELAYLAALSGRSVILELNAKTDRKLLPLLLELPNLPAFGGAIVVSEELENWLLQIAPCFSRQADIEQQRLHLSSKSKTLIRLKDIASSVERAETLLELLSANGSTEQADTFTTVAYSSADKTHLKSSSHAATLSSKPTLQWVFQESQRHSAYGVTAERCASQMSSFEHVLGVVDGGEPHQVDVALFFDFLTFQQEALRVRAAVNILRLGGPGPMRTYSRGSREVLMRAFGNFDAVIAVSPELASFAKQFHPKVYLIPNSIDLTAWSPTSIERNPQPQTFVAGLIAKLVSPTHREQKGFHIASLAAQCAGAELFVVGQGVRPIASENVLTDFYSQIDVLVHPVGAGKEGTSNAIMESLALGIPVVTTSDAGFHGRFLKHGVEALIVPRTSADVAAALQLLKSDCSLRDKLARQGRLFAEEHHDILVQADRYERLCLELLTASPMAVLQPVPSVNDSKRSVRFEDVQLLTRVPDTRNEGASPTCEPKPSVFWIHGSMPIEKSGWAYEINARRLSSCIHDFQHMFGVATDTPEDEAAIFFAFDTLIYQSFLAQERSEGRRVVRVGGRTPLETVSGGRPNALREILSDVDAVIALSPALQRLVSEFHDNVFMVPNGLDLDAFHPRHRVVVSENRKFTVGMAASLKTHEQRDVKGYYIARAATEKIGADFLVVGRGVNEIAHSSMISEFYSQIDCLVHPVGSGKEGSSNVIMECLALGIPVITTAEAGFHGEVLRHGEQAFISPRLPADVASALTAIREDSALSERLSLGGRAFAERVHDIHAIAATYASIFKSLLNKSDSAEFSREDPQRGLYAYHV